MEKELENKIKQIKPVDRQLERQAKAVFDAVFKPIDGLGRLEDILCRIAAIQGSCQILLEKRAVFVFCSDNGIVQEHISQSPSEITRVVAANMAAGKASINRMAACCHTKVVPVDIGMQKPVEGCLDYRVTNGTKNFAKEPAMERKEVIKAILTGIELVFQYKQKGYNLFGTGEMGIGNTTTTSALSSLLLKLSPQEVTGRGAGLSDIGLARKYKVIEEALVFHFGADYNKQEYSVISMLEKVGGLDIAGLTGVFLGGALYQVPIIIDGVISACAAVLAARICPIAKQYMLASHLGKEPAHEYLLEELGLTPIIYGDLALGEGTGAVLLIPMLDMALSVYYNQETFVKNHIEAYKRQKGD